MITECLEGWDCLVFSGESADAHTELLNFCKDFAFERMGCFTFSEEEGTAAASFPEQVRAAGDEARATIGPCFEFFEAFVCQSSAERIRHL